MGQNKRIFKFTLDKKKQSEDDMRLIYSCLGNDCNRFKTIEFIESGYNLNIILD